MADCAMFTAWSPMRSRSPLMRETARRKRRSAAMGACKASRRWTRSSISICISLMASSSLSTASARLLIGIQHSVHGLVDGALGEAAHPQQALLQFFEIMFPMAFHGYLYPAIAMNSGAFRSALNRNESADNCRSHPNRPVM